MLKKQMMVSDLLEEFDPAGQAAAAAVAAATTINPFLAHLGTTISKKRMSFQPKKQGQRVA